MTAADSVESTVLVEFSVLAATSLLVVLSWETAVSTASSPLEEEDAVACSDSRTARSSLSVAVNSDIDVAVGVGSGSGVGMIAVELTRALSTLLPAGAWASTPTAAGDMSAAANGTVTMITAASAAPENSERITVAPPEACTAAAPRL